MPPEITNVCKCLFIFDSTLASCSMFNACIPHAYHKNCNMKVLSSAHCNHYLEHASMENVESFSYVSDSNSRTELGLEIF